jgi:hypothetical protein
MANGLVRTVADKLGVQPAMPAGSLHFTTDKFVVPIHAMIPQSVVHTVHGQELASGLNAMQIMPIVSKALHTTCNGQTVSAAPHVLTPPVLENLRVTMADPKAGPAAVYVAHAIYPETGGKPTFVNAAALLPSKPDQKSLPTTLPCVHSVDAIHPDIPPVAVTDPTTGVAGPVTMRIHPFFSEDHRIVHMYANSPMLQAEVNAPINATHIKDINGPTKMGTLSARTAVGSYLLDQSAEEYPHVALKGRTTEGEPMIEARMTDLATAKKTLQTAIKNAGSLNERTGLVVLTAPLGKIHVQDSTNSRTITHMPACTVQVNALYDGTSGSSPVADIQIKQKEAGQPRTTKRLAWVVNGRGAQPARVGIHAVVNPVHYGPESQNNCGDRVLPIASNTTAPTAESISADPAAVTAEGDDVV